MLTPTILRDILQRHYNGSVDNDFFRIPCAYHDIVRAVNGMRLEEIKKILREIKSLPDFAHIPLDRNKPFQIEALSRIVFNVMNPSNSGNITTAPSAVRLPPQQILQNSTITATVQPIQHPHPPPPMGRNLINTLPMQAYPRFQIGLNGAMSNPIQDQLAGQKRQERTAPLEGPSISLNDRNSILNTSKKKDIFFQLSVVSGITKQDILREIQDCPPEQLSKDNILLRILSRKDPEGKAFVHKENVMDSYLKQQEDAALDQAILESEKERENIQMRKKRRVDDLKNNIQAQLLSAEEFQKSVLLHGVEKNKCINSSSSSSTSSSSNQANNLLSSSCLRGSKLIRMICLLFEHLSMNLDPVELVMMNSSKLRDLRTVAAELLLLEADTIKYYKDAAYPYLICLITDIDSSKPLPDSPHVDLSLLSQTTALTKDSVVIIDTFLRENLDFFCTLLVEIVSSFQKGLCKIPKDGGLVPDMLRRKRLMPYITMLSNQLDQDGFELIDSYKAMKLVSDDEREEEPDDEEEEIDNFSDC